MRATLLLAASAASVFAMSAVAQTQNMQMAPAQGSTAQPNAQDGSTATNDSSYGGLTRAAFEGHYLAVHGTLPTVVEGLSSRVVEAVALGSCRFIHIDASHLYEHVAKDLEASRLLAQQDCVVVMDDYRSPHTPGVAAAAFAFVVPMPLSPGPAVSTACTTNGRSPTASPAPAGARA